MKRVVMVALIAGASSIALASTDKVENGPKSEVSFDVLDVNGDGYVSAKEAAEEGVVFNAFKTLDVDKDGKLSPSEFDQSKFSKTDKDSTKDRAKATYGEPHKG